jgi:hypothetical protein
MPEILIRAKQRQRILHMVSDSIPQQVRFAATAVAGGAVSGVVEVRGSRWLFRKPPVHQALLPENLVHKGFLDTLFSIHVTPDQDIRVTLRSRHVTARMLAWVLAGVVILGAAAAGLMLLGRGG